MGQRYEGKNVEEALGSAAEALGVERYQLTYHVVLEKRGFLGGMKRVVIEAEINEGATQPERAAPLASAAPAGTVRQGSGQAAAPQGRGRRGGRGRERGERRDRERDGNRERRPPREERYEDETPVVIPDQGPESEAAAGVRNWCEQVLALAKFELAIRTEETADQIQIRLYGRDASRMIDRHGELLDALQVLANKALTGRAVEKDIELDCAAFKEKRVEELGERARATADRVRRDGREQLLPAMSPIERRIVHLALQDDAEVMTESRGDGFYKRVAIKRRPAGEPAPSEP
jgi:spoIIIJ-associated protein